MDDANAVDGLLTSVDNLRIWSQARNKYELLGSMYHMVDSKNSDLAAQWMLSQGLSQQSAQVLADSSKTGRQMELFGVHSMQKTTMVGPLIWKVFGCYAEFGYGLGLSLGVSLGFDLGRFLW